jgi:pimeloyl-ACP methyl ester carboxylesterase
MGGQIALTAALELPDRVAGLVLLSTAGFEGFTEGEGDWMKGAVTPKFVAESPVRQIAANLHSNFHKHAGRGRVLHHRPHPDPRREGLRRLLLRGLAQRGGHARRPHARTPRPR